MTGVADEKTVQVLNSIQTILNQQQNIQAHQQEQLNGMQEQLGMLTEVATKLAIMEERRSEDKLRLNAVETKLDAVRDEINKKFPQYDALNEIYKNVNNKVWAAIFVALGGLVLGAAKLGLIK